MYPGTRIFIFRLGNKSLYHWATSLASVSYCYVWIWATYPGHKLFIIINLQKNWKKSHLFQLIISLQQAYKNVTWADKLAQWVKGICPQTSQLPRFPSEGLLFEPSEINCQWSNRRWSPQVYLVIVLVWHGGSKLGSYLTLIRMLRYDWKEWDVTSENTPKEPPGGLFGDWHLVHDISSSRDGTRFFCLFCTKIAIKVFGFIGFLVFYGLSV